MTGELDSEAFGRLDITPDKGLNLSFVDVDELKKDENVVIFIKDSTSKFKIVKGIYKVDFTEKGKLILIPQEDELGDKKIREALAHALVTMNKDAIMEQALIVAEKALSRKPIKQLKSFFKQKKLGKKLELK